MRSPVSVIIPSYNSELWVVQAIESALAQTLAPSEIIVVDDGSTDDTCEQLRQYAGRIIYLRQENHGVSAARNRAVRESSGALIAFLDADDVWHPRKLEYQARVLDKYPDVGLLGTGRFDWPTSSYSELSTDDRLPLTIIPWHRLVVRNYLSTSSVLVRREFLEQAGEFDTQLQGPEDRDLWLRIAALTTVANLELPLTGYRFVDGSVSRQANRVHDSMKQMLLTLDSRGVWKRRPWLRHKAYSHVYFTSFQNYREIGDYSSAMRKIIASLAWYPLPFSREEIGAPFARVKGLILNLQQLLIHRGIA